MLLQTRPLYDNVADSQFFVTPDAWDGVIRALQRGLNVALVGARGVGKTTLLRQMQMVLRNNGERVVFVDATAAADTFEIAVRVRDALLGQPAPMVASARLATSAFSADPAPLAGASRALAEVLREIGRTERTTILVDASASAEAVFGLFGRMRDVLWQQEHQWVVAIEETDRATALKPPADAFFDSVVILQPWSINELVDLLARRADANSPWPRDLLIGAATGANGSPREALRVLSDALVHDRDASVLLDARGRLLDHAAELGRPTGMLMAELLSRGQASPSDKDLQVSLGVTRSRLTQMLRQLLASELVTAESERGDGPGRPRIVYRPALPT
jgi:energy-coupling factor transporter ATP-binding protein EcfA2